MVRKPFRTDPSATESFQVLSTNGTSAEVHSYHGSYLRAVVIGGGTGAPMSIRTLLSMGVHTSAVVAMADDGGSTGILREEANVTPPGDIRKCIAAFARDPQDPLVRAFKYRFAAARDHALGNLLLAALEDACQSFPDAISICERLVDAQGHVFPSTLDHVTLRARTRDGRVLDSQAQACHSKTALESVQLYGVENDHIDAYEPALRAIAEADLIVLGPGSLFTSIIPNLLVPGVIEAIQRSHARVVFVCSVADMQGETWGLTAYEHVQALMDHGMEGLIDYVLVHTPEPLQSEGVATGVFKAVVGDESAEFETAATPSFEHDGIRRVALTQHDILSIQALGPVVIARNLASGDKPAWHSPAALRDAFQHVVKLSHARLSSFDE